ncbi:nucleoside-diphosphate kinase [bacterium]|nr:nucleoside-diphosphate kinase [bacterium]|tara:strand:- start:761 stop:1357 length:597 start_codon:yes stop_codon:yes gene_type:complete
MSDIQKERTVVLVKPDGVKRGLIGEILTRFEKTGLKVIAIKMVATPEEMAQKHYPESRTELMEAIGGKTLETYQVYGKDANEDFGTMDPVEIGKMVNKWNIEFLTSGPVVAILFEGLHAITNVRQMVGNTLPSKSEPGTIRGDYSLDSPALANEKKRSLRNLIHASGNEEEAKYEEQLWFKAEDIHDYVRSDHEVMFE